MNSASDNSSEMPDQPPGGDDATARPARDAAPAKSARRRAREFVVQGLYQWLLANEDPTTVRLQMAEAPGFDRADRGLFMDAWQGVITEHERWATCLQPLLDRPYNEVSPIERAILLLGTYEIVNRLEVPYRVVINEAVELAKTFGGIDGHKYVNGVLDKLAGKFREAEVAAPRKRRS